MFIIVSYTSDKVSLMWEALNKCLWKDERQAEEDWDMVYYQVCKHMMDT